MIEVFDKIRLAFSGGSDVLWLFLIPIGGGIPGGVVLGNKIGMSWSVMTLLYLVSDIILAVVFEPLMYLFLHLGRHSPVVTKIRFAFRETVQKTTARFGTKLGPLTLVMISFGVDPMTGRAATATAGHGFIYGWTLAITGDLFYFGLIMVSTLWLNNILGNGTAATIIILILMFAGPPLFRKVKDFFSGHKNSGRLG